MFIGREQELQYLKSRYQSRNSEMIVIYGRRRIGKTELIKQFISDLPYIYYSASEVDDYEQLGRFSRTIAEYGNRESISLRYGSWDDAFLALKNYSQNEKLILVIDEFPYMVNSNKSIPSILQNLWDHQLKDSNTMIILSGSSISFMVDDVLGSNNPLYGRITGSYKLNELSFDEACKFFPSYTYAQCVSAYSVLGGVPQYLLTFDDCRNVDENIVEAIMSKGAKMYDEVNLLMKQELRETAVYFTLLEAIAMGNTKLNEIYQKTMIDKTKINTYLSKLIALDIIDREFPVTEKQKRKANVQSGLYKIKTNFFKFYFRFVFTNNSMLELGAASIVYERKVKPHLQEYTSLIYEDICRARLLDMNINGELTAFMNEIGRWWDKQSEIDIVGFNDQGEYIFGECKWREEMCGVKVYEDLVKKSLKGFTFTHADYFLFSKSGYTDALKALEKTISNLTLM